MPPRPDRLRLSDRIEISRALTGLWQVADIEKDGATIDPETGAGWLADYVSPAGLGSLMLLGAGSRILSVPVPFEYEEQHIPDRSE